MSTAPRWQAGLIPVVVPPPPTRSATSVIHAETFTSEQGVAAQTPGIGSCDNGDWVKYAGLDFGIGVSSFTANLAVPAAYAGQKIEIHIDSLTGPIIGTLTTISTGSRTTFVSETAAVTATSGVHDL